MLCLFKNAILPVWGQWLTIISGWSAALGWLYFSFIDQGLAVRLVNGQALMVDLLLAFPIVLFIAVIVYAFCYWLMRLLIILLFRSQISFAESQDEEDDLTEQEALYGKEYWKNKQDSNDHRSF